MAMEETSEVIKNLLKRNCSEFGIVSATCSSLRGTGYCSQMARVNAQLSLPNSVAIQERSFIAKFQREKANWLEHEVHYQLFPREIKFFTEIMPVLESLLQEAGNSDEESIIGPRYICHSNDKSIIIMEDLKVGGFEMLDRTVPLGLEEGALAMRALARLHGASAVSLAREILPRDDNLKQNYFSRDIESLERYYRFEFESFADLIENSWEGKWSTIVHWLRRKAPVIVSDMKGLSEQDPADLTAHCHGDFWNCNIMFKMSPARKVKSIRLIDFQNFNIGSIGWDLMLFFYTQPELALYFNKRDEMISIYTEELSKCLKSLNADHARMANKCKINAELKRLELFGLLFAIGDLPHIMGPPKVLDSDSGSIKTKRSVYRNEAFIRTMKHYFETTTYDFSKQ